MNALFQSFFLYGKILAYASPAWELSQANRRSPMKTASLLVASATIALCMHVDPAAAQASRTWVSGVGDDANPCSRTAPCKTFAGAISKTALNGEINCLDPAGFGTVTITKSITIDCHEIFGSILNASINGLNIPFDNFTAVGEVRKTVRLRNINFNGFDTGVVGISITGSTGAANGGTVVIEDCLIDGNFAGSATGIRDSRTGGGRLTVTNTGIRNMGSIGIEVRPASGATPINATIEGVRTQFAQVGIVIGAGVRALIDRSVISGNGNMGLAADGGITHLSRSVISSNGTGVAQSGSAIIVLHDNDIAFNTTAISGATFSTGTNRLPGNSSDGTPPTPAGSATSALGLK
jgi:hypothetical protein